MAFVARPGFDPSATLSTQGGPVAQKPPPLAALRDQIEQQLGAGFRQRHEAEFVDDEKLVSGPLLVEAQQASLIARFDHFTDPGCSSGEADGEALLTGGQPDAEGDVGLTGARWPKGDDVLAPAHPLTPRHFQNLHPVQLRDGGEVEAVQAFDGRDLRRLDTALDHPTLPIDQFQFDKPGKIPDMVHAFRRALPRQRLVLAQERGPLQRGGRCQRDG